MEKNAETWEIVLNPFDETMYSFLTQTPTGMVKFAHRSVMEFLFVTQLIHGDPACYGKLMTGQMRWFFFSLLQSSKAKDLAMEFLFFTRFELGAYGSNLTSGASDNSGGTKPPHLFKAILNRNPEYEFVGLIDRLIQNPIFFAFGWDARLYENLENAMVNSEKSLMKSKEPERTVVIEPKKIMIKEPDKKTQTIFINESDLKMYHKISNHRRIQNLNNTIGLEGLIKMNNINQSGRFCILPDLTKPKRFAFSFWVEENT